MAQFNGVLSGNSSFLPSEREETIIGENAIKEQTIGSWWKPFIAEKIDIRIYYVYIKSQLKN